MWPPAARPAAVVLAARLLLAEASSSAHYAYASWSGAVKAGRCSDTGKPERIKVASKTGSGEEAVVECSLVDGVRSYRFPPGIFEIDEQLLVPERVSIAGARAPNDMSDPTVSPDWREQTLFLATRGATDYASDYCHAKDMVTTRVGFVLSSHVSVRNVSYQGVDTIRPMDNGALCGGAAFETKGCAENDCRASGVNNGGSDGVGSSHVVIENVRLNDYYFAEDRALIGAEVVGNSDCRTENWTAECCFCRPNGVRSTQVGVWVPQTRNAGGSRNILIKDVVSRSTQGDGINLHGYVEGVLVDNAYFENTGDDVYALWGAGDNPTHVVFKNSVAVNPGILRPNWYGVCVATYGLKSVVFENITCRTPTLPHPIPSPDDGAIRISTTMFVFYGDFSASYPPGNRVTIRNWRFEDLSGEPYAPRAGSEGEPSAGRMVWSRSGTGARSILAPYFVNSRTQKVHVHVDSDADAELEEAPAQDVYGPAALADELKELPGAPTVHFRMFSGFIDVSAPGEAAGTTRQMFYWFVESQSRPREDPLLLWTNGGPGCSGLGGFLSENGPFRASEGGKRLVRNDFSWNKVANMVFIESPMGVGFSFSEKEVEYTDEQTAADNLRFVLGFFARYPLYASSDFYLSSESYGGHYLPTLAQAIEEDGRVPQFKGIFLGNPFTYLKYANYGMYGTAWGHQLLPRPLWQSYEDLGCKDVFLTDAELSSLIDVLESNDTADNDTVKAEAEERLELWSACDNVTWDMENILENFDMYALDFPKCPTDQSGLSRERWIMRRMLARPRARAGARRLSAEEKEPPYWPCALDYVEEYLSRQDVQAAIGTKPGAAANWSMCSDPVFDKYSEADVEADVTPVWRQLIGLGKLKVMIYSGDDDTICATMGTQEALWEGLGLEAGERYWEPWKVDGQVAGFLTDFRVPGAGNFSFATVHGAGHMVPQTQPARSLALLEAYLGVQAKPDVEMVAGGQQPGHLRGARGA